MKALAALKSLEKYVVFDLNVVRSIIKKDIPYTRLFLHRLKKLGYIFEIERNRYTVHRDAFLFASRIAWPSYISLWSAIRFHNLTEQIPHSIWVVTTRKRRKNEIKFADAEILFVLTKPKYFFGFKKIDFKGVEIFIAEPEKSIIDGLLFRKISVSEIFFILKSNLRSLNTNRILNYAVKTKNKSLIKRIGFLFDRLGLDYYNKLRRHVRFPYTALEYNLPAEGKRDEKWKIVENITV